MSDEGHSAIKYSQSITNFTSQRQSNMHGFQALRYFQAVCNHPCLVLKPKHLGFPEILKEFHLDSADQLRDVQFSGKLLALRLVFLIILFIINLLLFGVTLQ